MRRITLELSEEDVKVIIAALAELESLVQHCIKELQACGLNPEHFCFRRGYDRGLGDMPLPETRRRCRELRTRLRQLLNSNKH